MAGPTQTVCFEHQWAYLSRVNRKIKQSSGQHRVTVAEPEIVSVYISTVKKDKATKWLYSQVLAPTKLLGIVNDVLQLHMPVDLYMYEEWSFTLKEKHKLLVSENKEHG